MTRLAPMTAATMLVAVLSLPATARQTEQPDWLGQIIGGLIGRFLEDSAPALENLQRDFGALAESLEPTMRNMADLVDDIGNYERPERLENGDILIRRKEGAPPPPPLPELRPLPETGGEPGFKPLIVGPNGEIEL